MRARGILAAALVLALTAAAGAGPAPRQSAQLEAGAQRVLDRLNFGQVDARSLSTRQLAAIHTQFDARRIAFGRPWIDARGRMRAILRWDGFETR